MSLKSQVTSLEMSKKLQEAGFKGETCFYWYLSGGDWYVEWGLSGEEPLPDDTPCWTFQQIWEVLASQKKLSPRLNKASLTLEPGSKSAMFQSVAILLYKITLPDAAASALLWAIGNGYVEVGK